MSGSHPASRDMDMLHGPVARKMLVFALPVALTGLFQQLFTAADIFVLGRFVGKEAMAAAGNNIPAISLIINLYTPTSSSPAASAPGTGTAPAPLSRRPCFSPSSLASP